MFKRPLEIILLVIIDIVTVFTSLNIAIFLRKEILPFFHKFPEFPQIDFTFFWWIFPVWFLFLFYEGLYTRRFSFWDEIKALWKVAFFSTVTVFSILYLGKIGERVSRTVLVLTGLLSLPLSPLIRINTKRLLMRVGLLKNRVIILGAGKTGGLILNAIRKDSNLGFDVIGFLDDDPEKIGKRVCGIKVHNGIESAHRYISRCRIRDIIIAMPGIDREKLVRIINNLQHKVRNILFIPDLFGIAMLGTNLQHFFHEQVIGLEVRNNLARPMNILIKRLFDIIVGSILLLIFLIPIGIISVLIKINSKGPAIYSQERIGRNNKPFRCYKFRTMYDDAEERFNGIIKDNPDVLSEWERHFKIKDDPRVTDIGRFLRSTSLDELPQLLNVVKGEMSLVGPRPVTLREIEEHYKENARVCFSVPPGITGLWQVSGRSSTTYKQRIALDSWYVRNWNLWLDIVILFKTIKVVIMREGAW
ncbi:MAG: undecaprenyl-phosphate galactose phosphotransferase WbaP [Thermodesulfovibrionia bacterium]